MNRNISWQKHILALQKDTKILLAQRQILDMPRHPNDALAPFGIVSKDLVRYVALMRQLMMHLHRLRSVSADVVLLCEVRTRYVSTRLHVSPSVCSSSQRCN